MSRKWSPAVEVARDNLYDQLLFSGLPSEERWQLIDALVHALAEQQRAWALDYVGDRVDSSYDDGIVRGAELAADEIDPGADVVRPGEGPTP